MKKQALVRFIVVCLGVVLMASCSKFRKIEKSEDWRVKYEAALKYYEKKDYYKASVLFEQVLPIVRGLPEGEKVQFYFAYCQFHEKMYLLASHHFKVFYETYARSDFAEEAQYMYAYSLYRDSPIFNLDQTSSYQAITAMQMFLNRYPGSQFRDQASDIVDQLQQKLEKKGYENAKQYYKIKQYKAAIVAFDNFKRDYPDSDHVEEISFLKLAAEFNLAEQSIRTKQRERYKAVIDDYLDFIDKFEKSSFLREAERMYATSLAKLKQIENTVN
jgi:outer membrane protein assembly factor BamD